MCEQHEKLDVLWFFVKNHLKSKTIVFLSSCKQVRTLSSKYFKTYNVIGVCFVVLQVRFVYEAVRRMRPGVPVMCLHGGMQQMKRIASYESFKNKQFALLFATDIAARGLGKQ